MSEAVLNPGGAKKSGREVIVPFGMAVVPMTKLAIVNFEKRPDKVYRGLELQYFDGGLYGTGYRVIAYRCDGFVDVYDQPALSRVDDEDFSVTGKGLCQHLTAEIEAVTLASSGGGIDLAFSFMDKAGRRIVVDIEDRAQSITRGMNLLAPIGSSSEHPTYLPLFWLEGFDFVRKNSSRASVSIDGREIAQDSFPVPLPKDLQWRYYSRYAARCQIVEFARAGRGTLNRYTIDEDGRLFRDNQIFQFAGDNSLGRITLQADYPVEAVFSPGIPDLARFDSGKLCLGDFRISGNEHMGFVSGEYRVKVEGSSASIEITPSGGWTPRPNSPLTRMMFSPKSVFCSWPATYRFTQRVDLDSFGFTSGWERLRRQ